jgi:hypothetical protein
LRPEVIVVGTEAGSQYPESDVVEMYERYGAQVLRTDLHGTVRIRASRSGAYQVLLEHCDPPRVRFRNPRPAASPVPLQDRPSSEIPCP